ncbi:MAG: YdeI/OmpD-associated family protein [Propionibacteriales bacterium]|nr:YdeI/OmpD-associated family protein [Propionibacteriales bacterium]
MTIIGTPGGTNERPCTFFSGPDEFRAWLVTHHESAEELWMGLYKKHVDDRGLTWDQAVPEALCFGWIDSLSQRVDDDARRQRWTPRRPGSNWSAVNIALVEKLTAEGRMQPAGLAAFEARRTDRSAIYSYETAEPELSPEFAARVAADPIASAWLAGAPASYRRVAIGWVMGAKREPTRDARLAALIDDSAHGRLIKSQRYGTEPAWARRLRTSLGLA